VIKRERVIIDAIFARSEARVRALLRGRRPRLYPSDPAPFQTARDWRGQRDLTPTK